MASPKNISNRPKMSPVKKSISRQGSVDINTGSKDKTDNMIININN